jgi:Bacterial Ig-like domain
MEEIMKLTIKQLTIKQKVMLAIILASSVAMTGCNQPSNDSNVSNVTSLSSITPTGTIQGNLIDAVTEKPIVGAVIDIGLATATTNQDGQFVLRNIPATNIGTAAAAGTTLTGTYQVSINLKGVTSPVKMSDATITDRYPDFSFKTAQVFYTSDQGHPLTGVANGVQFMVGKQSANIAGVATDKNGKPVAAGLTVTLYSAVDQQNSATGNANNPIPVPGSVLGTTTTDTSGKFAFANIEAGIPIIITVQDTAGTLLGRRSLNSPNENATLTLSFLASTEILVKSTDIVPPVVVSVTPASYSDITPVATNVVFTFSKPIKQTSDTAAVSPSTNPNGLYQLVDVNFTGPKPLTSNLAHTLSWSADFTQLIVAIPALGVSSMYTVDITPAVNAGILTDAAGNFVDALAASPATLTDPPFPFTLGNQYALNLTDSFTTNGGATALAPTIALVNAASINAASMTSPPVTPTLDWLPTSGAMGYNIYRATNRVWGAGATIIAGAAVKINTNGLILGSGGPDVSFTLAGLDYVDNTGAGALTYTYTVKAVNSDGTESAASNAVTAADVVAPSLWPDGAVVCGGPAATCVNGKIIAITVPFDEQMDKTSAQTVANYTSTVATFSRAAYTPGDFTVPTAATVTLTLTTPIALTTVPYGFISTGPNGIASYTLGGDDVPVIASGNGINNGAACVTQGVAVGVAPAPVFPADVLPAPGGDDLLVAAVGTAPAFISTGPDGICNTTARPAVAAPNAAASNVQTLAVNAATVGSSLAVSAGPDGILQSTLLAPVPVTVAATNVLTPAGVVVTVAGVTDVAGNVVGAASGAGMTKYNADGTVQ